MAQLCPLNAVSLFLVSRAEHGKNCAVEADRHNCLHKARNAPVHAVCAENMERIVQLALAVTIVSITPRNATVDAT